MSTLKKYQTNPRNLINTALGLYRSKKIKTAVVEGLCDKRFIGQWIKPDAAVRFDGFDGKTLVENVYDLASAKPYSDYDFLYYFMDVDYDEVANRSLRAGKCCVYNVHCFDSKKTHFNDLETFLINSPALEKVLSNIDLDVSEAGWLRERLAIASRAVGCLRAADEIARRRLGLRSSILNGLEPDAFFHAASISIDESSLRAALPRWSNYPEHVEDLLIEADRLNRDNPGAWVLSRGHDVTRLLALHFDNRGKHVDAPRLELLLRLACEFNDFAASPIAKRLLSIEDWREYFRIDPTPTSS